MNSEDTGFAEETKAHIQFTKEFLVILDRNGLANSDNPEGAPRHRAASVLLSEIHDWYRSGDIGQDHDSFAAYCESIQEANYVVDDERSEMSAEK